MRITKVITGSPAWEVGLQEEDGIVCVDGYQIGDVNGVLYLLDRELQYRADDQGWVRLLVWNHRNGRLQNIDVQLARDGGPVPPGNRTGISGQVTFDKSLIPTNIEARLRIVLFDTSKPMGELRPLATLEEPFEGHIPIEFDMEQNVAELDARGRYGLKAYLEQIREGKRRKLLLHSGDRAYPLKHVKYQQVELKLRRPRL